jgi:type I restriction enzyme M protein
LQGAGDGAETLVTRAEIARLAGIRRPTVTTWTKRHSDFPKPVSSGGEDYFSLTSVASWLDRRAVATKDLIADEEPGLTYGQRVRRNWPRATEHHRGPLPVAQEHDTAHAVNQLLGTFAPAAARKGGGSEADYLVLLICLVFLRNCAEGEWRMIRETALHPEGIEPDALIRLIGGFTDQTLRARGIVPGVQSVLERVRPRTVSDLVVLILQCDEFGPDAVDPLLARFGTEAQLADESYFTPSHVARMMATIVIGPGSGSSCSMYDPYVRGGELATAVRDLLGTASLTVRGESPDLGMLRLAGMNLALHSIPAQFGTEYAGPSPNTGADSGGFNVVLTNPPFNSPHLPGDEADPRWIFGSPPTNNANYAWLQIAISSLRPDGMAAVLMPLQATVTSDEREHRIRSRMIQRGAVSAVISLPPRLFTAANVAATLWILQPPADNPRTVLFVDARRMTMQDAGQVIRKAYDQQKMFADGQVEELEGGGIAARASIDTIRQRKYSLNPADYLGTAVALADGHAMEAAGRLRNLKVLRARLVELDERIDTLQFVQRVRFDGDLPAEWKRVPLSDVCDVQAGPSYSRLRASENSEGASVPVIASRHLQGGHVIADDTKHVTEDLAQRLAKFRLTTDDILCVRSGATIAPAIVEAGQDGWLFDTNLLRLRVRPGGDPRFLLGFLSLPAVLDWMRDRSTGSAIAFITAGNLKQLEVPLPPLAEQRAIASSLLTLDELIAAHEDLACAVSDARAAISAHLMQGGLTLQ